MPLPQRPLAEMDYDALRPVVFHLSPAQRRTLTRAMKLFAPRPNRSPNRSAAIEAVAAAALEHAQSHRRKDLQ